jgi:hypothetical protein
MTYRLVNEPVNLVPILTKSTSGGNGKPSVLLPTHC